MSTPNYVTITKLEQATDGSYCYIAYHPELPTVISQGETATEARSNLAEATELALEHLTAHGLPIPAPMEVGEVSYMNDRLLRGNATFRIVNKPIQLGVIEFHTSQNKALIDDFYHTVNDLRDASCIVDLWLMDIAAVLKKHGYKLTVEKVADSTAATHQV